MTRRAPRKQVIDGFDRYEARIFWAWKIWSRTTIVLCGLGLLAWMVSP